MNPEADKNTADLAKPKNILGNIFSSTIFYLTILLFIIGFNFSDRMAGNWYQQFLPNITGAQLNDVTFIDSLTGFSVTDNTGGSSYILKTMNSGDNWVIKYKSTVPYRRVIFINQTTGFVNATRDTLYKTTDAGESWQRIVLPTDLWSQDMAVHNQDTIWLVLSSSFSGGVFRTTNGGASWENQLDLGSQNPDHVYFYNGRIGFISRVGGTRYIRKTTNSGLNWDTIDNNDYFMDMYFADSTTGWKCSVFGMKKTTNSGINWSTQTLPNGGIIQTNGISSFTNINKDTIWANGGFVLFPNNQVRSILNRTTNGGQNWLFQIPDTANINNIVYYYVNFVNNKNGWATDINTSRGEIHTTNGGDTTFLIPVTQTSSEVLREYRLEQNYPNPFNPVTNIKYSVKGETSNVKLIVFDIQGKQLTELINQKQSAGTYQVDFNGSNYSSGLYFYSLIIDGKIIDTRKMILLK